MIPHRLRRRAETAVHLVWLVPLALLIEVTLRVAPLPTVCRWAGVALDPQALGSRSRRDPVAFTAGERRRARAALSLMARWPFGAGSCLRQALLVGLVLRRHHPILRLGIAEDAVTPSAHAWVEIAGGTIGAEGGFLPFSFEAGT